MNKHILLTLGAHLTLAPLSNSYTISKIPIEGTNYYKVKYNLDNEGGFYTENGLLREVITKEDTKQGNSENQNYKINYVYHNYKAKINNHESNIQDNNGYISMSSTVIVDSNYKVISIENWHPVVFYLNNLRAGLLPVFDKQGEYKNVLLKDNSHTYEGTCDSTIKYSTLSDLKVEYKVSSIETIVNKNNVQIPMYTFDWHALTSLNKYSTRHGKIQVTNKGIVERLSIYVPLRISKFYITSKVDEQSGWLSLVNIDQKKFIQLCSINSIIKTIFETEPEIQYLEPEIQVLVPVKDSDSIFQTNTNMFKKITSALKTVINNMDNIDYEEVK